MFYWLLNKRCSSRRNQTPRYWILRHRFNLSPWWRHQMETLSALLALCAGNSPWIPLTDAGDADLWGLLWSAPEQKVDNGYAGDLRRHGASYDVTVILTLYRINHHPKGNVDFGRPFRMSCTTSICETTTDRTRLRCALLPRYYITCTINFLQVTIKIMQIGIAWNLDYGNIFSIKSHAFNVHYFTMI